VCVRYCRYGAYDKILCTRRLSCVSLLNYLGTKRAFADYYYCCSDSTRDSPVEQAVPIFSNSVFQFRHY